MYPSLQRLHRPPFGKQRRTLAPCSALWLVSPNTMLCFVDHDDDMGYPVLCRCYKMPRLLPIGARGPFAVAIATEHIRTAVAGKRGSTEPQSEELWPLEVMAQVRNIVPRSVWLAVQSRCQIKSNRHGLMGSGFSLRFSAAHAGF